MTNPFSQLTTDEINALIAAVTPALTALANGDGSTASIVGQGVVLEGQLVTALPTLQKVGVNDLAKDALAWLAMVNAAPVAPAPTSVPVTATTPSA